MADQELNLDDQLAQIGVTTLAETKKPDDQEAAPEGAGDDLDKQLADLGVAKIAETPAEKPQEQEAEIPEDHESDYGDSALRGLKHALAPHLLTKQDFHRPVNKGEMAVEMGTNIAADVAAGAALGATIGSVVPVAGTIGGAGVGAIAAPIIMGLYRGMGYEVSRSKAEGQEFNPARAAVNVVAEINPLTSKGGRLMKFLSQAALEGAREYTYTKDGEGAGISAVLGGAFAAAFHHSGAGWFDVLGQKGVRPGTNTKHAGMQMSEVAGLGEALADESHVGLGRRLEGALDQATQDSPDLFDLGKLKAAAATEEASLPGGATSAVAGPKAGHVGEATATLDEFKKWVADKPGLGIHSDDANATFAHYEKTHAPEVVDKAFKIFQVQKIALQEVDKYNVEVATDLTQAIKDPITSGMHEKLRDVHYVMRKMDEVIGSNFTGTQEMFNTAKDKKSVIMAGYLKQANALVKKGRQIGLSNEDIGKHLDGKIQLQGEQLDLAQEWAGLFEDLRGRLNQEGLKVEYVGTGATYSRGFNPDGSFKRVDPREPGWKGYLTRKGLDGSDAATAFRREAERLESIHGGDYLKTADAEDLRRAVAHKLGMEPDEIKYRNNVEQAIQMSLDPKAKKALGFQAGATFQRDATSDLPQFMQDFDVGRVFTHYMNNNLSAALNHDAFLSMESNLQLLKRLKFDKSADMVNTYLSDMSGHPSDMIAWMQYQKNKFQNYWQTVADKNDGVKGSAAEAFRAVPDMLGFMTTQIYPNWLGLNVKAITRNYMQPLMTTAPELGGIYGRGLVLKAMAQTAKDAVTHGWDHLGEFLKARNMSPGEHFGEGGNIADSGLRSKKVIGAAIEGLDWYNQKAMALYSGSDDANRYVTYKVAEMVVKDAEAGNQRALAFLNRFGEGNKAGLREASKSGNMTDTLARQLIAKTQFNYGKENASEYGRQFGRFFSAFTKWPAMVYSDGSELVHNQGFLKGGAQALNKYVTPMLALGVIGNYVLDVKNHPVLAYTLGDNLADAAPAQSFKLSVSPVFKTGGDLVKTMMDTFDGELDAGKKADAWGGFATKQIKSYVPFMSLYNEPSRAIRVLGGEKTK